MSTRKAERQEHASEAAERPAAQPDDAGTQQGELSAEAARMLEDLKSELDEAIEARKRALADFANYQRRAAESEARASEAGAARVIRSLLGVLDHFNLALDLDPKTTTVDQLLGGVRIVRDELIKALEGHGVSIIRPAVGDEFDPNRHEAMLQLPAEDVAPNHIVSVFQPGYSLGDVVLRPAKVAVAAARGEGS